MSVLYIEPFSGLSGDMFLGALCGLTDAYDEITQLPKALNLPDGKVEIREVNKNGIVCKQVKVIDLSAGEQHGHHHHSHDHSHDHDHHHHEHDHEHEHSHDHEHDHHHHDHSHSHTHHDHEHDHHHGHHHHHPHRHLKQINDIIDAGAISDGAKAIAREIFQIIGKAESKIHNIPLEKIHFHEVSGVDSIIDIVGAAVLLDKLQVKKCYAAPVCTGHGMVKTQHGLLPVPAPATADILRGMPVYSGDEAGEKVTPTGAAILSYLKPDFAPPVLINHKIAYGPGTKDFRYPNVLRASLVSVAGREKTAEQMYVVESNIDDSSSEYLGSDFQSSLLESGATDFYFTPVQMKKGRPGLKLTALVSTDRLQEVNEFILENTSTIGLRYHPVAREILPREDIEVATKYGPVKAKQVTTPSGRKRQKIEYESISELSKKHNISIQQLQTELYAQIVHPSK